jgi:hypothetical protein
MDEKSARDRYDEMLKQPVDAEVIRQAPDLEPRDEHPSVVEVQNFLKRFGYLDAAVAADAAVGTGRTHEPGRLDEVTVRALTEYQRFYSVGTHGTLDAPTRELMVTPRCGVPDVMPPGPAARFVTACSWNRHFFKYGFGKMTTDVHPKISMQAVGRAFRTWANAGYRLSFGNVEPGEFPDILVQWLPVAGSIAGLPIPAAADFPPRCGRPGPPRRLDFFDKDITWAAEWGADGQKVAIEDVAVHEIGHLLGLDHTPTNPPRGNVMHAYLYHQRILGSDDLDGLRALGYGIIFNYISPVHSGLHLQVRDASFVPGAPIEQGRQISFSGASHQKFWVEHVFEPGGYRFIAEHSGQVLDVEGGSHAPGARLIQYDWHGGPNQRFRVDTPEQAPIDGRGPTERITALHSGLVLDVLDGSTAEGAQIVQSVGDTGRRSQFWRFS